MRVLLCHNYYQQRGGEDHSFEQEADLLASRGHAVDRYTLHNNQAAALGKAALALKTIWNRQVYRQVRERIRRFRPDVVHFTNTFPLMSPAAHYAARKEGVPVVQALRNYRFTCANALLLREGSVCELCVGRRLPLPALRYGCYRDSRAATAMVVASTLAHRWLRTWPRKVDLFYTLTEFARGKLIEAGLPTERIVVKPNFVPRADVSPAPRQGAVFVGRLSAEKGIETLLAAWAKLPLDAPLTIVGDGPLAERVRAAAAIDARIRWLGSLSQADVRQRLAQARLLVMPSVWYETFGRTIIEAYSVGTPVLASRLGAMAEVVEEGRTGRLFQSGDAGDLARVAGEMLADEHGFASLGRQALARYESHYTPDCNYGQLLAVYRKARSFCPSRLAAAAVAAPVSPLPPQVDESLSQYEL